MKSAAAGVIAMVVIAVALAVAWQQHPDDRVLLWSDEFNGSAGALPDRANWSEEEGYERNDELQTYTVGDPRTASMDGLGSLRITVQPDYTSGSLTSQGRREFQYGYFEARIRTDSTMGIWPAWWLEGSTGDWPEHGEIDILERVDNDRGTSFSVHGGLPLWTRAAYAPEQLTGWHTYAARVSPGQVDFYLDGELRHSVSKGGLNWPFDKGRLFMRLNLAFGGTWPDGPDSTTALPASMEIDYVRVYAL